MKRTLSCDLEVAVDAATTLELQVAVADVRGRSVDERLVVELDGRPLAVRELRGDHGTRLHVLDADPGLVRITYRATVDDDGPQQAVPVTELERLVHTRPSRYVQSDALVGLAVYELGGTPAPELPSAVAAWVGSRLAYAPGASRGTDGALETLALGAGVCRDYTHLAVAMLRALDVPARAVAVYAPGCWPMDFHAVVEAAADGTWQVHDATALAPRQSLVRISTGRDAADNAFLSNHGGSVRLLTTEITAVVDGDLPLDDGRSVVHLR